MSKFTPIGIVILIISILGSSMMGYLSYKLTDDPSPLVYVLGTLSMIITPGYLAIIFMSITKLLSYFDIKTEIEPVPRGFTNRKQINQSIKLLFSHFSITTLEQTCKIHNALKLPSHWKDPIMDLQAIAMNFANHIKINVHTIVVSFKPNLSSPGTVELSDSDIFFIELSTEYKDKPYDCAAILAHEIAHIFLHKHGLGYPDALDNEILTDTTAIFMGFGHYILQSTSLTFENIDSNTTRITTKALGYLTPDELYYVMMKRNQRFGGNNEIFTADPLVNSAIKSGSKRLAFEMSKPPFSSTNLFMKVVYQFYKKHIDRLPFVSRFSSNGFWGFEFDLSKSPSIVFNCPICSRRLKLPFLNKEVWVKCSLCAFEFKCRP